jgi:hypothetical protein
MLDALAFFIPHPSVRVLSELEPQIMLLPVAIAALVEEISLSLILKSNSDQLLVHPNNFFVIILPN